MSVWHVNGQWQIKYGRNTAPSLWSGSIKLVNLVHVGLVQVWGQCYETEKCSIASSGVQWLTCAPLDKIKCGNWKRFKNTTWPKSRKRSSYFVWFWAGVMQSTSQPQKCPVIHKYHLEYELCLNVFSGHCTSYQLFTIYNSSHVKVRFGRSHTKAWTWRFQRVKLQGRWSVVLLHSPTLIQQSAATTQLLNVPVNTHKGNLAYKPSHVTVLSGERWEERKPMKSGPTWQTWDVQYVSGGRCFWIWEISVDYSSKNGTFLHPETISTNWLAVYLKEKGKCLPNILKQKYRHFFLTYSRPWHALHCLLCICNSDLPTTTFSTKEVFFAFYSLYRIPTGALFRPLLLRCVHTYISSSPSDTKPGCISHILEKRGT